MAKYKVIFLCTLSGILFSLSWVESLPSVSVFIAFVPLLVAQDELLLRKKGFWTVWFYYYFAFMVWSGLSTWWIYNATLFGAIMATIITAFLMSVVFLGFHYTRATVGIKTGFFALITYWIAYELFFHNSEIQWPWLTLGNSLGNNVQAIQWYEYSGVLGGSLWILLVNITLYTLLRRAMAGSFPRLIAPGITLLLMLAIPIIASLSIYHRYAETAKPANVLIIQPNIDPYNEKFSGLSNEQQLDIMLNLAEQEVGDATDFVICPETAIDDRIWEHEFDRNYSIARISSFVKRYPNVKWVTGVVTLKLFNPNDGELPPTVREYPYEEGLFYDRYNAAIQIDSTGIIPTYHKSKLVVGVEMMPYPRTLKVLEKFSIDLGGITGSLGTQPDRGVFFSADKRFGIGPVICYESVFGEFMSGYVKHGANLIVVITNDGWWGDTPGYHQHLSYSRIRAIELRRSVARSANTGISAIINQRGDIVDSIGWWKRGVLKGAVNTNDKLTYYARQGDYIGRLATFFGLLTLGYTISRWLMTKRGRQP